jgi:hypothetical protein
MRIVLVIIATLSICGCAIHKKTEVKKEVVTQKTENIKQLEKVITDSCLNIVNLVKNNFGCVLGSRFDRASDGIDSSGKVMYWPWTIDSTFLFANSNCWVGLTKNELISVLGKPYAISFWAKNNIIQYEYMVSNNRYNAGSGKYYEYWKFNLIKDVVTLSAMEKHKTLQKDKKPQKYKGK